jgi:hypothetical protein
MTKTAARSQHELGFNVSSDNEEQSLGCSPGFKDELHDEERLGVWKDGETTLMTSQGSPVVSRSFLANRRLKTNYSLQTGLINKLSSVR